MRHPARFAALACAAALGVAACSAATPKAQDTSVFTAREDVTLQQVKHDITALYAAHPGIASFDAQDVQYTTASRDKVLAECTTAGGTEDSETAQITACAPLIFFLYSYGKQASVAASVQAARDLYWYSVTHITGPSSPRAGLDEILSSWKLPVPALTPKQAAAALASSVVAAADDSMLAQDSVRIVITSRISGTAAAETIAADVGTSTGDETMSAPGATAEIRVTGKDAYFTGNQAGLTSFLGLSAPAAKKTRGRWVRITSGTSEYQDLAEENTMSSVPDTLLPASDDSVSARVGTESGAKVYVLTWKTTASDSPATISAELTLTDGSTVLPVSETLTDGGETKVVTLSDWGRKFTVRAPGSAIPYSAVTG